MTNQIGTHRVVVNDDGHYECTRCGKVAAQSDSGAGDYLDQTCAEYDAVAGGETDA